VRTELTAQEAELLQAARSAALSAYAPYSRFRVGAAILTDIGQVTGCNVENASYGLSICAERCAVFSSAAAGARSVLIAAVSCIDASADMGINGRMPCGACRQVLAEFMAPNAVIVIDGAGAWTMQELLPQAFLLRSADA
jgi:cytidine deaminase